MSERESLPPTILVIFGVSGDLARRKLLPAISQIDKNGQLPKDFRILGVSRRELTASEALNSQCRELASKMDMFRMDLANPADYDNLRQRLNELTGRKKTQVLFYLSVPPSSHLSIIRHLGKSELSKPVFKLMLEKPFGVDLESARQLINETNKYFQEGQVYRIDHYLAKEMAQNIAVFIGGNALFRDVWSKEFIEKIEVVASEKLGIEGRAAFYEQTGALRDLVQSHLLQLTALILMKPCPDVLDFSQVPGRRTRALQQLEPAYSGELNKCVMRGQYEGYRKEVNNPHSKVETFVYLKIKSRDPRWEGVPIELITGKALDRKYTEIRVYFKKTQAAETNRLTLRIQPHEGMELDLWVKKPGYAHELARLPLDFNYEQYFGQDLPDAYEQVLIDAMRGSQNLFASSPEVLASWALLEPVQKYWSYNDPELVIYKPGSSITELVPAA